MLKFNCKITSFEELTRLEDELTKQLHHGEINFLEWEETYNEAMREFTLLRKAKMLSHKEEIAEFECPKGHKLRYKGIKKKK